MDSHISNSPNIDWNPPKHNLENKNLNSISHSKAVIDFNGTLHSTGTGPMANAYYCEAKSFF
jgi:hypothetical protein